MNLTTYLDCLHQEHVYAQKVGQDFSIANTASLQAAKRLFVAVAFLLMVAKIPGILFRFVLVNLKLREEPYPLMDELSQAISARNRKLRRKVGIQEPKQGEAALQ